jgi:hypothetical protein
LISRFIDPEAEFIFVPPTEVIEKAKELDAVPYDVHGVELTHDGELCSFDAFLKKYQLDEPELLYLALIVRGADTDRHDLTPESGGLFAISLGLSDMHLDDDQAVLRDGFIVYDALYRWLKFCRGEKKEEFVLVEHAKPIVIARADVVPGTYERFVFPGARRRTAGLRKRNRTAGGRRADRSFFGGCSQSTLIRRCS